MQLALRQRVSKRRRRSCDSVCIIVSLPVALASLSSSGCDRHAMAGGFCLMAAADERIALDKQFQIGMNEVTPTRCCYIPDVVTHLLLLRCYDSPCKSLYPTSARAGSVC